RATVKLFIGETGEITNVALTSSSGSPRLDNAATTAARTIKCTPYRQHGKAVPVVASKSYVFRLDN
ncbi:TonB family protein, partial [Acinetobacter baumannii]